MVTTPQRVRSADGCSSPTKDPDSPEPAAAPTDEPSYALRAQRKPILPAELSGVLPIRAETR